MLCGRPHRRQRHRPRSATLTVTTTPIPRYSTSADCGLILLLCCLLFGVRRVRYISLHVMASACLPRHSVLSYDRGAAMQGNAVQCTDVQALHAAVCPDPSKRGAFAVQLCMPNRGRQSRLWTIWLNTALLRPADVDMQCDSAPYIDPLTLAAYLDNHCSSTAVGCWCDRVVCASGCSANTAPAWLTRPWRKLP